MAIDTIKYATMPALLGLNQYLKNEWGMSSKYCTPINYVLGIGVAAFLQAVVNPEPLYILAAVMQGITTGFLAGLGYDLVHDREKI